MKPILTSIWAFAALLLCCEFGEHVSTGFDGVYDAISDSDWHSFSVKIQKMLPVILNATQKPIIISGFGNVSFKRETLKKVNIFGSITFWLKVEDKSIFLILIRL